MEHRGYERALAEDKVKELQKTHERVEDVNIDEVDVMKDEIIDDLENEEEE